MRIFFDLDGTLIDSTNRLYLLFKELVKQTAFTYDEYWSMKRKKINHKMILMDKFSYTEKQYNSFERQWLDMIELDKYLLLDKIYSGVCEVLEENYRVVDFYVVTARQNKRNTIRQLDGLGLNKYFKEVFVTENKFSKETLLKNHIEVTQKDIIVGDTGFDILAGRKLGMKTVAASYGFLSKEVLLEYSPDYIIDDFYHMERIIKNG
jgi:phosphoglycolate phosphatase